MEENKIGNIEATEVNGSPALQSDSSLFPETLYFNKFYEDKEYGKFIRNVEKLIRTSKEYQTYIELLRTNVNALNLDNILSFITTEDADLEFHHYPLSLYDIVDAVSIQKFFDDEKFTSFNIAKEVMDLHYKNKIGLVPLSKTTHELAHAGEIFISSKQIYGDYKAFMKKYPNGISDSLGEKIKSMEDLTKANHPSDIGGLF